MPLEYEDPIRLRIMKAMCAAIEEISPDNGFASDFSGRVFRGRTRFGASDPIPMVSILEAPIPLEKIRPPQDATDDAGPWELVIQAFVKDDKENPCDPAYVALADLRKRMAQERSKLDTYHYSTGPFGLGRLVYGMYIGTGVVRPPDEISEKAYCWLQVTLDIAEDMAHPYGHHV